AVDALWRALLRIETLLRAGRVDDDTPTRAAGIRIGEIPVGAPLPDIAGHVVQTVAISRERFDWRRARVAVFCRVVVPGVALEGIALRMLVGERLIAPDVLLALQAASRGEFPLGLGGQPLARPFGVGNRVEPGDVDDGVVVLALDGTAGSFGMAPVGAGRRF